MKCTPLSAVSVAIVMLFAVAALAGEGSLDPMFGFGGKVVTDLGGSEHGEGIAFQTDGKIVVAVNDGVNFLVLRYLPGGTLDSSFDADGVVSTSFSPVMAVSHAVAIQPDGKIVAVGSAGSDMAIVRYDTNGALDPTFDLDGKATIDFGSQNDSAYDVALQSNGSIVLAGVSGQDFAVARLTSAGALDPTFDVDGKQTTDFLQSDGIFGLAIQADGKIVVAGVADAGAPIGAGKIALARYLISGSLDITFGNGGKVTTDFGPASKSMASDLAVQADGKLVVAGLTGTGNFPLVEDFALVRYLADGSLDSTFDGDGRVTTSVTGASDWALALAIQADGRIVAAGASGIAWIGQTSDFAVARYLSNGALDATFDGDGLQTTDFSGFSDIALAVGIQSDGKIVLAGQAVIPNDTDLALARYLGTSAPFNNKSDFTNVAWPLTTIDFDKTACGSLIVAPTPGVLAAGLYVSTGVIFSSGVIFDVVNPYGATPPSSPNVISNTAINTPTPALVSGTFDYPASAVGITNTGAQAELRVYDVANNLVASIRSDTNAAAPDFIGITSSIGLKRFEFDFVSGVGFEGDDLVFSVPNAILDCTAPQLFCPANIVIGSLSPTGTVVSYTVNATDNVAVSSLTITPPSGTKFPIGQTTVTAVASDPSGNTSSCSFTVTVLLVGPQISQLITDVDNARLAPEITKSLRIHLQNALQAADDNDVEATCKSMNAFIDEVRANAGEQIPERVAVQLMEQGGAIQQLIRCSDRGEEQ